MYLNTSIYHNTSAVNQPTDDYYQWSQLYFTSTAAAAAAAAATGCNPHNTSHHFFILHTTDRDYVQFQQ